MFERFTTSAREVVLSAHQWARELRHSHVGTEHLLLAMLEVDTDGPAGRALRDAGVRVDVIRDEVVRRVGPAPAPLGDAEAQALRAIGIDLDEVRARVEEYFGPGALDQPVEEPEEADEAGGLVQRLRGRRRGPRGRMPFMPRSKKVLELALREAIRLGHRYIGPEHILLGLLREGQGLAVRILVDTGVDLDDLKRRTLANLGKAA